MMPRSRAILLSILWLLAWGPLGGQARAQEATKAPRNITEIDQTSRVIPSVVQDPKTASALRAMLRHIVLPKGFRIDLYAIVPGARHMAVGPRAGVLFVGTRESSVWVVADRDGDGVADDVREFAPGIQKKFPNGVAFDKQGTLYVAEHNRILAFPDAESTYRAATLTAGVVRENLLAPQDEHSNHAYRVIDVGPDDKLYVTIGQPYNVWPRGRPFQDPLGTIVRMERDGTGYEVFARGIRNSVGLDFHPRTGELWFTDNQVDGMGDDIPPGELNRAPVAGLSFGFPWYGGGMVRTREWLDTEVPPGQVSPEIEYTAHAADLGMAFYTGRQFPQSYTNDLFTAQHGSWDRSTPVGAQVMHVDMDDGGNVASHEVFASGWLNESTGRYRGRPVDVAVAADGALLVSDDFAGAIYRISYVGE